MDCSSWVAVSPGCAPADWEIKTRSFARVAYVACKSFFRSILHSFCILTLLSTANPPSTPRHHKSNGIERNFKVVLRKSVSCTNQAALVMVEAVNTVECRRTAWISLRIIPRGL